MYLGARGINTELHAQFLAGANMPLEIFSGNNLLALWPQERQKIIRRKFAKRFFCAFPKKRKPIGTHNIYSIAQYSASVSAVQTSELCAQDPPQIEPAADILKRPWPLTYRQACGARLPRAARGARDSISCRYVSR